VLAVAGAVALVAGGVAVYRVIAAKRVVQSMNRVAAPLLRQLRDSPEDLPRMLEDTDTIVMVSGRADATKGFAINPISSVGKAGSLTYERMVASRRGRPPEYWALVFDERVESVAYWVPLADPRRARAEPGGPVLMSEAVFSFRVPFEPDGWVAIYRADLTDPDPLESHRQFPAVNPGGAGPTP
jgi:hypothetical protein